MFQFPGFPALTYGFSQCCMVLHHACFHIRRSADRSLFAAPRSLSQLVTSFIGSWCQGIHLTLLFAWTSYTIYSVLLELSEFLLNMNKHIQGSLFLFAIKRFILYTCSSSTFRWNCTFPLICLERQIILMFVLFCSFLLKSFFYSVVNDLLLLTEPRDFACHAGRSGWTRTIDLSVISRVL